MQSSTEVTSDGRDDAPTAVSWPLTTALPRRLALVLGGTLLLLAVGHMAVLVSRFVLHEEYAFGLVQFLDLDDEQSLGTWVATTVHLACALLAGLTGLVARQRSDRWARNWFLLAVVFTAMSVDEAAALHENLIKPVRAALGLSGVLYYAWVLPVLAVGLVFLLSQLAFLRAHWQPTGRNLVLAGALFVAGAAGMEMLEGVVVSSGDRGSLLHGVLIGIQEVAENAGVMLAAVVLATHLVRTLGEPHLVVTPSRAQA